ncbi:hypothetical protein EP7_003230 [Isosphaeraceae bacterium EP7]
MSLRRSGAIRLRALAASALALTMAPGVATAAADPSWPALAAAYRALLSEGRPMLVVVTSAANPDSGLLASEIAYRPEFVRLRPALQFVELSAEAEPGWMERLKVKQTPCMLLYKRNAANKAEMVARLDTPRSPEDSIRWLSAAMSRTNISETLAGRSPGRESTIVDPEVRQTGGHGSASPQRAQPTPQQPYVAQPEPPTKAPPSYAPPVAVPPPNYAPPAYAPPPQQQPPQYVPVQSPQPVVVQTAPSPVLIQQQAPNIMIQAAPPPTITILNPAPTAGPTINYVNLPPAMAAPPVLPLFAQQAPQPQPVYAQAPQPMYAPAPQPVYAQAPQPVYAQAPQPVYAAPPVQAAAPQSAMVVTTPRLFGRVIGAVGEGLSQFKNPRLQMAQAPVAAMQMPQAAPGIIPVYAQQGYGPPPSYPPQNPGYYPPPAPPPTTTGSPQQDQPQPGLIHRMLNH